MPLVDLGDKITTTYAVSLYTPELWTTAVYVYTHLSSPAMRERHIRSLLAQYSYTFAVNDADAMYKYLVEELKVPSEWIHAAAALKAKVDGDNFRQTMHLIKAGELDEAHEVLCRSVGPDSVISRDYDALRELLAEFVPNPTSSPKEPVEGWNLGGQVYLDYIQLLDLSNNVSSYRVDEELNREINELLSKLQRRLETIARNGMDACGLEERVALTEIAGDVAKRIVKSKVRPPIQNCIDRVQANASQHAERSRVLQLPLTEDRWLRHSSDLSLSYYRAVMATGK
jgi:nuclear pore complex protein Nup98-Nup96